MQVSEPLEKQKTSIVEMIDNMHNNMREYAMDVEDKLEKAYSSIGGGLKKFGLENISRNNSEREQGISQERNLEMLQKNAV